MTSIVKLLNEIRQHRVCLWVEDGRLRYRAPKGALSDELLEQIKARKQEIIDFLLHANAQHEAQLPVLRKIDRQHPLPLSFAQQRLWFLQQLAPNSTANNMPVVFKFDGLLDIDILKRSIQEVVHRHEVLRTRFPIDGGQPTIQIEDVQVSLPVIDLLHLPEIERAAEAYRLATHEAHQPFDLVNGPIFRCQLFKLQDQKFLFIWNMHCIICDGASSDVFYQDLTQIYQAFKAGLPSLLPELSVQYLDFAHWQRQWLQGEVLDAQLSYWKENLVGSFPPLKLPFDYPKPRGKQVYNGARTAKMLSCELNQAVLQLGQQEGATQFMILLAAFQVLLHRYSSQTQFLINVASAGRGNVEAEGLVGFFSNTLLFKTELSGDPTFRELLLRVKQSSLEAFPHQDIPFSKIIEEVHVDQQTQDSLFQVKFALNPPWSNGRGMATVHLSDLTITSLFGYIYHGETNYDLILVMREQDEGLGMVFDYNADIFSVETMERMVEHFHTLLQGILDNPDQLISRLPFLTDREQQTLLPSQPASKVELVSPRVHQLFEDEVSRHPDAIALTTPTQQWTYHTLNQRANQLAHYLLSFEDITSAPVAICLDKSVEMIAAHLAVLKIGGTYLSLDTHLPTQDQQKILTTAQVKAVITTQPLAQSFVASINAVICVDSDQAKICSLSGENPPKITSPLDEIACILVNEENVGIKITHTGLILLVEDSASLGLNATDRILQWASPISEVALFEIYAALLKGSQLVLPSPNLSLEALGAFIQQHQISTCVFPSRLFNYVVEHQLEQLQSIQRFIITGDLTSPHYVDKCLQTLPDCHLWKAFSTPETSGFACWQPLQPSSPPSHELQIGSPLDHIEIYIFDDHQQLVPMGVEGNLYLGGARVAAGYLDTPTLDLNHCIPHPLKTSSSQHREYLFFTGERAKRLSDGSIVRCRRASVQQAQQTACLNEVELALAKHPLIKECKVIDLTDPIENQPLLVAYVVAKVQNLTSSDLYQFLKQGLPSHLIPSNFVVLEALPLILSGEVDLENLPFPSTLKGTWQEAKVAAQTPLEQQLAEIWQKVLKVPEIGVTENFFDLGGNSLLAMSLAIEIEKKLGKALPLASFFQAPTIRELTTVLQQEQTSSDWSSLVPIQPKGNRPPLFCVHFVLRPLTNYLGPDQPIYALRYGIAAQTTTSALELPDRIESLAAHYVEELRRYQPKGPYYLMGSSFGGTVAFEMAQQLLRQGEKIALLAIFDTSLWVRPTLPESHNNSSGWQTLSQRFQAGIPGLKRSFKYRWEKLQFQVFNRGRYTPHFYWGEEGALFKPYHPQFFAGKVLFFHALDEAAKYQDPEWLPKQWQKITAALDTFNIPGDHNGILQEPHVHSLVQVLQDYLEDARKDSQLSSPTQGDNAEMRHPSTMGPRS